MKRAAEFIKHSLPSFIFAGASIYFLSKCAFYVDGGFRAIKFSRIRGLMNKQYAEGWHLMLPYFEQPIIYDMRSQPRVINARTGCRNLQKVEVSVRLLYRPMEDRLAELYRYLGRNYAERVLPSLVKEVVKVVVVPFPDK